MVRAAPLKPFSTNGCTGFPDGTLNHPELWRHCCILHDLAFWAGGCERDRDRADLDLRDCVSNVAGAPLGFVLYVGVRIGSWSPIKIKSERWNHGWQDGRAEHTPLSAQDVETISRALLDAPPSGVSPDALDAFLARLRSLARNQGDGGRNCSAMHSEIRP